MLRLPLAALALALLLAVPQRAYAQISDAQCKAGFGWTFNSRGQSPCTVAAYLDSACQPQPSDAYIQALDPGAHYVLTQSAASECFCNTVFYSIISACAVCQGNDYLPWTTWRTNCTTSFTDEFPRQIPVGTSVPAWAYQNLKMDYWNATDAETYRAHNSTDIAAPSAPPSSTSSLPPSTSSAGSVTFSPISISETPAPAESSTKKTNVGAIVGGVIGGVAAIVLAVFALLFWLRHRKAQRRPPSAAFRHTAPLVITPYTPEPTEKGFSPHVPTSPYSTASVGRLYNPEDPSTFPDVQPVGSVYSQSLRGSAVFSAQNGYQPAGIRYTGVPEV